MTGVQTIERPRIAPVPAASLAANAAAIIPDLQARADGAAKTRRVPDATIEAFRRGGIFRALQPGQFGGSEAGYDDFARMAINLAKGCGSSAWVGGVLAEHAWVVAGFGERVQDEVWGADPEALVSSSFRPLNSARRVDGGYVLDGDWPFSSGCDFAQWAAIGSTVQGTGEGLLFLAPIGDYEIVDDWHVLGLEATGSKTLRARNLFVPNHRAIALDAWKLGDTPGRKVLPDYALGRAPRALFAPFSLISIIVGLAHRAVELGAQTRGLMVESDSVHSRLAEAGAAADAAQLIVENAAARGVAILKSGRDVTLADMALSRRDGVYAAKLAFDAIEICYRLGGARSTYDSAPMQRVFRDAATAMMHISVVFDRGARPWAQMQLGRKVDPASL